jgi:peptidoglycan-N-acetylglucosamine deacetylase
MSKQVIVTTSWDDGHVLDLKLAKLLTKHGIKGTFYISPQNCQFNKADLLSNDNVIELSKDFEIGAHTMTHLNLKAINADKARAEIEDSKKHLEGIVGKTVVSFCYPCGAYTTLNTDQVKAAGFKLARTTKTFALKPKTLPFETPTSVHVYNHFSDIWKILSFVKFNLADFFSLYLHWDRLAIRMFDHAMLNGGVFHVWGHSWEIDKNNNWEKLDRVLKYIAQRKGVTYCTNGGLVA